MATTEKSLPRIIALIIAMTIGSMMALQVRVNGELGTRLDDGFIAATISFGLGLVLCAVALVFSARGRVGLMRVRDQLVSGRIAWWTVLGGVGGAFFVLSQSLVGTLVGIAMFSVAVVAGQTVSGLVIDGIGFGPGGKVRLTPTRMLGAVLVLCAVTWSVSGKLSDSITLWAIALPVASGLIVGWQQAVNGRVRAASQSVLSATFINFLVGTTVLVIAVLGRELIQPSGFTLPDNPWLYLGGPLGCAFIAMSAFLVSQTGVLLLGMGTVAGQLITSVVVDLIDVGPENLGLATIGGAALALIAALIAALPSRTRPLA